VPYRFIYPFDIRSHLARKNPLALVRAFRAAFAPTDESVRLILRVNGQLELDSGWPAVARAAAADPRIMILSGTWSRADALNTMAACDCLVSPHRAEGFGRNIAEALLLGLQVLAAGYAGCMDFLTPDECVAWSPARVAEGAYPFATGMIWAEPDHDDLVDRMQEARAHPKSLPQRRARSKALDDIHAPLHVGRQVAARLTALQNARNSVD
jgi:glycosyltransferase involved in cell wall biosynthesis